MSQENVEAVRSSFSKFNLGDWEEALERLDADVEWAIAREHPESRTLHGKSEVLSYLREWRESLGDYSIDIEEVAEAGDQVVVIGRMRGRGAASGAELDVAIAFVYTIRDEKTVRVAEFLNREEALEAAGLSER